MTRRHGSLDEHLTAVGQSQLQSNKCFCLHDSDVVARINDDRIVTYRRCCLCGAHVLLLNSIGTVISDGASVEFITLVRPVVRFLAHVNYEIKIRPAAFPIEVLAFCSLKSIRMPAM